MRGKNIIIGCIIPCNMVPSKAYFDNSATTKTAPEVLNAMMPHLTEEYGNPGSIHSMGDSAAKAVREARQKTAKLIGCQPSEVIFTSGGTESDNIALIGSVPSGGRIITTAIEHSAILETCAYLKENKRKVTILPTDDKGRVDPEALRKALSDDVFLVSVMTANNVIGTIQDIKELADITHEYGALFHTDAVQAFAKMDVNVKRSGADMLSISGHKIHGPKGIGALYVSEKVDIKPIMFGGGQESGMRPSTENVPGMVGLGAACELAEKTMNADIQKMEKLRNAIIESTLTIDGSALNGPLDGRLCNNAHFRFKGIKGTELVLKLSQAGIMASTASACSAGSTDPSHVMTAIGLSPSEALSALRISLSRYNTMEEVQYLAEVLPKTVASLR